MNQIRLHKYAPGFLMDWAAVIALAAAVAAFSLLRGGSFFSAANMVNILRSMSITTIFAIGATITMAPDGFDMSACTLATVSSFLLASLFLWFGMPLWMSIVVTVLLTMALCPPEYPQPGEPSPPAPVGRRRRWPSGLRPGAS